MCKYCEDGFNNPLIQKNMYLGDASIDYRIHINEEDKELVAWELVNESDVDILHEYINIQYCPMCGRKL